MEDYSRAIEDQQILLSRVQRIVSDFDKLPDGEKTRGLCQSCLDKIDEIEKTFEANHEQLFDAIRDKSINPEDVPYFKEDVHYSFFKVYLSGKGKLLDFIAEYRPPNSPNFHSTFHASSSSQRNNSVLPDIRLPKIDIPTFSGDYLNWISYRDMFISMVHNNQSLSNVQKYYFLKNSCRDTPLSIVNEYPASETSYALAWDALDKRYHNKRKIADTVLRKLLSIPKSNGSCESIKTLLDSTRNSLALLSTLGIDCSNWDPLLIHITVSKLDLQTCKEWEQSLKAATEIPKISELYNFLETTFRTLESIAEYTESTEKPQFKPHNSNSFNSQRMTQNRRVNMAAVNDDNCPCCGKRHFLYKCFKFAAMSSSSKREFINSKKICRNCLNFGHISNDCKSSNRCKLCNLPHHTIIHNDYTTQNQANISNTAGNRNDSVDSSSSAGNSNVNLSLLSTTVMPQVLLATIRVIVKSEFGNFKLRAILDQGAQATLITESASQLLHLKKHKTFARITGVGGETVVVKEFVKFKLTSHYEAGFELRSQAYVMPSLNNYCTGPVDRNKLPSLAEFSLADPDFDKNDPIDLLIGGDLYGDILLPQQKKFDKGIFLQLTHFGWIVSGPTSEISYAQTININLCSLNKQFEAMEQEELIKPRKVISDEMTSKKFFKENYARGTYGVHILALPLRSQLLESHEKTIHGSLTQIQAHVKRRFWNLSTDHRAKFNSNASPASCLTAKSTGVPPQRSFFGVFKEIFIPLKIKIRVAVSRGTAWLSLKPNKTPHHLLYYTMVKNSCSLCGGIL
ncbi:uncharacterized protein [Musca autumnalis]|uniref:uncharacterized protein n=1 Tax=Musca autumnalis TaxID=221902 RepID=UPI003CEFC0EC